MNPDSKTAVQFPLYALDGAEFRVLLSQMDLVRKFELADLGPKPNCTTPCSGRFKPSRSCHFIRRNTRYTLTRRRTPTKPRFGFGTALSAFALCVPNWAWQTRPFSV